MGNNHNLFGVPHEAHVFIDDDGYLIKKVITGSTLGDSLSRVRYDKSQLHDGFRRIIAQQTKRGELTEEAATNIIEYYESSFDSYTYLLPNGNNKK
jgi:arginine decarboxylase-like protein